MHQQIDSPSKVFVMSADETLASVLNFLLLDRGFKVEGCVKSNYLDALENHQMDILILDESFAGAKGTEVLQEIVIAHPNIPVVFLVNHPHSNTAVESILLGTFAVLAKPVEVNQLAMILLGAKARKQKHAPGAITDQVACPDEAVGQKFRASR